MKDERYSMLKWDINPVKMFSNYGFSIKGMPRSAMFTCFFGTSDHDTDRWCRFALVSFYGGNDDILIEIGTTQIVESLSQGGELSFNEIDKEWFKKFLHGTEYEQYLVEKDGRLFMSGFCPGFNMHGFKRAGRDVVLNTRAIDFLSECGNHLAVALGSQSTIKTLEDSKEAYNLISDVLKFSDVFDGFESLNKKIDGLNKDIEWRRDNLKIIDRDQIDDCKRFEEAVKTLKEHGIECGWADEYLQFQ